jgi:PAS domain S-box-containing protein
MAIPPEVAEMSYEAILEHDDLSLKPVFISPQVESLLGHPSEAWLVRLHGSENAGDLIGRLGRDFIVPEDREQALASRRQSLAEGLRNVPLRVFRHDGSVLPVEVSSSVIRDETGDPVAILSVLRDVTERLEADELRQNKESKSRFLATMSHELRTPLNSILGFAQLLESGDFGDLNERQRRYVSNIETSGRHLHCLVSDILDLAGTTSGQVRVSLQHVELQPLLERSHERHLKATTERGLALAVQQAGDLAALADPVRLEQALGVLLSNAIKFTNPGGRIRIRVREHTGLVLISVADTGVGIARSEQTRIFEDFTQVESGRARRKDGAGMGLALCRRLVELMGGTISLRSRPGRGSVFTIALPRSLSATTPI